MREGSSNHLVISEKRIPPKGKKGICGPTLILLLIVVPLLFSQNGIYPKIFK